ncbi:hypothetical protein BBJ28_00015364 [Nothophytophthora sp. Chile5]|nr:hypothetical protein BBJ28_00015364 [Nothophytophthora sp. Chile5]
MEIGHVLLRDAHYVWRQRAAVLEKDAVVLQPPLTAWQAVAQRTNAKNAKNKKQKAPQVETLPLDGSLSCEAVVVSSAHMHSVRLKDLRSGRQYLVDATTKGKKHMWIDLFASARSNASSSGSWRGEIVAMAAAEGTLTPVGDSAMASVSAPTRLDLQQAVEMLVAASETESDAVVVRGCDVESLLHGDGSGADFTENEAAQITKRLVEEAVLMPFCCSCSFVYRVDRIYRVNTEHELVLQAQTMDVHEEPPIVAIPRPEQRGRCLGHLLWLHESTFEELLTQFDQEEGLSGTDAVQKLLQFGAFNVPTAMALANELLHHELISTESSRASFQLNTTTLYKKVGHFGNTLADDGDEERHAIVTNELMARSVEERLGLEAELERLKSRHARLFNLFCFCCVLVLLDALVVTSAGFPGTLKLSLVIGLLLWLTLGRGTATLSIAFRGGRDEQNRMLDFSQVRQGSGEFGVKSSESHDANTFRLDTSATGRYASPAGPVSVTNRPTSFVRQESMALSRAEEAEVHSFRLAIAQAAAVPAEATHVFSDEYLFSVLHVKNRAFAYAVTKMKRILEWRRTYAVDAIAWDDVKTQLESGNMYWYGYDFQNRPILWVRAQLKDWSTMSHRREIEVRAHVFLLELGCRHFMPPGCTTYTIVTDSAGLGMGQVDLRLMHALLDVCVANFPDRIGLVHAGPLTRFLKYITSWLWPLLPQRLRGKVSLMHDCAAELSKHMKAELIPKHMGGTAEHHLQAPRKRLSLPTEEESMDITYIIDQQKRFMEELKI